MLLGKCVNFYGRLGRHMIRPSQPMAFSRALQVRNSVSWPVLWFKKFSWSHSIGDSCDPCRVGVSASDVGRITASSCSTRSAQAHTHTLHLSEYEKGIRSRIWVSCFDKTTNWRANICCGTRSSVQAASKIDLSLDPFLRDPPILLHADAFCLHLCVSCIL